MKRYACSSCKATFSRKWSTKRHIDNHHFGVAQIVGFDGFPIRIDNVFLHRSDEAQDTIRTTAGDMLFTEEYVREIARNVAREHYHYVKESSNKIALSAIIIQNCIEMFNNARLGSGSISKSLESLFKIHDRKE